MDVMPIISQKKKTIRKGSRHKKTNEKIWWICAQSSQEFCQMLAEMALRDADLMADEWKQWSVHECEIQEISFI